MEPRGYIDPPFNLKSEEPFYDQKTINSQGWARPYADNMINWETTPDLGENDHTVITLHNPTWKNPLAKTDDGTGDDTVLW